MEGHQIKIASDQVILSGRFFPPEGEALAHLVLHGATGVPQRYYRRFAIWAAARGIGVLTYDYRDFGASRNGSLRRSATTMATWCIEDQAAAEATLLTLAPEGPLWLLGHSIGGLGFPFRQHDPRFERVITLAAGFARVGDHPWSYRPVVLSFWYALGPIATVLAGYLPGRIVLLGADLPAGVYWQWRRWATSRSFYLTDVGKSLPEPHFSTPRSDLHIIGLEDDVIAPPVSVRRYADAFSAGRVRQTILRPAEFGLESLGHIGIMAERSASAWPAILGLPATT